MSLEVEINSGSSKDFELAEEGAQAAVLADVVDLGVLETDFGPKRKVQLVYVLEECDTEGRQKRVFERFTASLHEKAPLYKRITGPGFGAKVEGAKFDLESLLGRQLQLVIVHNDGQGKHKGKKFANVQATMKPRMGQNVTVPEDFQRAKDRPAKEQ